MAFFRAAKLIDWPRLRAKWLRAYLAFERGAARDIEAMAAALVADLRAAGWAMAPGVKKELSAFIKGHKARFAQAVELAPRLVADELGLKGKMADDLVSQVAKEVWKKRRKTLTPGKMIYHGDGLDISDRIWRIDRELKKGLNAALTAHLAAGRSTTAVTQFLQYAVESLSGKGDFAHVSLKELPKWLKGYREAVQGFMHVPGLRGEWTKTMAQVESYINRRAKTGSHWAGRQLIAEVNRAIETGRTDLIERAVRWWAYDRQLYFFKRIARTEAATAFHLAQIETTEGDPNVIGYHWRLSSSHPRSDICDAWAKADYGLGPGVWPKADIPRHKAHPH